MNMPEQEIRKMKEKMDKAVEHLKKELLGIRTGRAHPALVSEIKADYYGTPTPISQIGSITTPDARQIVITPWDKTAIKAVEKAIQASSLGINPSVDGENIRLNIPELTGERRVELSRLVKKCAEDGRVAVRNLRREANDSFRKLEKDGSISEDSMHDFLESIQKTTDEFIKKVDEIMVAKEKEILED